MKLSCLEMEKARRLRERESASQRIANIDARLQEIEAEEEELLHSVGHPTPGDETQATVGPAHGSRGNRGDGAKEQDPSSRTPCSPSASLRGGTTPSPTRPVSSPGVRLLY